MNARPARLLAAAALLAASCAHHSKATSSSNSSAPPPPQAAAAQTPPTGASSPGEPAKPRAAEVSHPLLSPGTSATVENLQVPLRAGEAAVAMAGCLTAVEDEATGEKFPVKPVMRGGPQKPAVVVSASGAGVVVTHELSHPCCLKAAVTYGQEAGVLRVRETLAGHACRCMCSSTVRTAVGLAPGDYTVVLELEPQDGKPATEVHRQAVSVRRASLMH